MGILRLAIGIGLLGLVWGCQREEAQSKQQASAPPAEVRLGYFANLTHAQAVLGVASGEFEQAIAPSKLKPRLFNAGPSLIESLFAGEIDLGYIGPGPAISGFVKSKGQGLRVIAGVSANGVLIVARKDAGIQKLSDLAGKRIATPQMGNTQDISARHFLREMGQTDLSNVLPIANADQASMMARGAIDAAWAPEPWASRLIAEANGVEIAQEKDLWPNGQFTLALIITTPEFLQKHPEVVEKVLQVHRSWTQRLRSDPQKHVPALGEALFALTQKKLPPGVLDAAIKNVLFTNDPMDGTLETMARWSYELGISRDDPDLNGLMELSLLNRLEQAEKAQSAPDQR